MKNQMECNNSMDSDDDFQHCLSSDLQQILKTDPKATVKDILVRLYALLFSEMKLTRSDSDNSFLTWFSRLAVRSWCRADFGRIASR